MKKLLLIQLTAAVAACSVVGIGCSDPAEEGPEGNKSQGGTNAGSSGGAASASEGATSGGAATHDEQTGGMSSGGETGSGGTSSGGATGSGGENGGDGDLEPVPVVPSAEYFVAPDGNDVTGDGSFENPFRTLSRAQEVVRNDESLGAEALAVTLKDGTYYLDETVVFTSEDSGGDGAPVIYRAQNEGGAVISGGQQLTLNWETHAGQILKAEVPSGLSFDQLFVDGTVQHMARYPNYTEDVAEYNGYAADAFSPEKAAGWADPAGGFMHVMHVKRWGGYTYEITGKDASNNLEYIGGGQNNRPDGMHESMRMVENIFEELDAPGEWFHDEDAGVLYFYPPAGIDMGSARVEVSALDHLIEFQGEIGDAVQHVELDGFVFRQANRTFMGTTEPLLRSDWTIYRGGAIFIDGAEDVRISNFELDQLGGNGVFVNGYNRRVTLEGCHIHDMGASGIAFVGEPSAVRNPLFQYGQRQNLSDISLEAGPQTDDYPADSLVDDCLIHDIGTVEKQVAGVQISMSSRITVRHTSIYDTARSGINISEGTFGGHVLEHLDVFDTVRETYDHGSFNSWGRDRFWNLRGATVEDLPELSLLDCETNVIRNSRFRCDHGWDIDLDDGSSNYEIYNNVLLNNGLKLREGFHRKAYNNIVLNNGLHPHVWYETSNDIVEHNIFMAAHRPTRMPVSDWGTSVDYSFFVSQAQRDANTSYGIDASSTFGDPLFVAPSRGDYRVASGSPALDLGFVNFDTLDVGVQKPALKAQRREPNLPQLKGVAVPEPAPTTQWNGAFGEQLVGEAFSAYGVDEETGGIVLLDVPDGSLAYQAGLREFDVIVGIESNGVPTVEELAAQTAAATGSTLTVQYSREQVLGELVMETFSTQ